MMASLKLAMPAEMLGSAANTNKIEEITLIIRRQILAT